MSRYLIIDQFKDEWFPHRDDAAYSDFYMTKYLSPERIRLKPECRLWNYNGQGDRIPTDYWCLTTHAALGYNIYFPFRFKKRYKVVIDPWNSKRF